jgi:hypothetical protein
MISRCTNRKDKSWKRYGGRGIRVCDRWMKFENFLADMGPRPPGTHPSGYTFFTIDRKESDGNYEPGNCRWASSLVQHRDQRR